MAADKVVHGRSGSLVRQHRQFDAGGITQQTTAEIRSRADTSRAESRAFARASQPGEQDCHVIGSQILAADESLHVSHLRLVISAARYPGLIITPLHFSWHAS
ncbi:hypothetical protein [Chelatococcus asaccharovorans]|uniref:hypothetical protein n=1 Tax=Chelatococcus asaccharovorans TaxID=28210 RepID=UPI003CCA0FEA